MLDWRFRDLMFMMMVWCECGKGCNIQFATSGDRLLVLFHGRRVFFSENALALA